MGPEAPRVGAARARVARSSEAGFGLAVVGVYVGLALGVHHCFPVYVFEMYGDPGEAVVERLALRDKDGRLLSVQAYGHYECDDPDGTLGARLRSIPAAAVQARERESVDWVERHSAAPAPEGEGVAVDLVRARFTIDAPSAALSSAEPVARCRVWP